MRASVKLNSWKWTVCYSRSTVHGGTPLLRSKEGMRSGDDRQPFIEFQSGNCLRKATSISALFNLHVRVPKQEGMRGLSWKPGGSVLRCWGQSGNDEKKKPRGSWRAHRTFTQKKQFSCSLTLRAYGKLSLWKSKQFFITEAPCILEPLPVRSKVCMRKGDERQRFIEFHSWKFLRKVTSISALFNWHVRVSHEKYHRSFSWTPGSRVPRCCGWMGKSKTENTPSFIEIMSCICSENAIQQQPYTACTGEARFMEIEGVC